MHSLHMLFYLVGIGHLHKTNAYNHNMTKIGKELRIGIIGVVPNIYIDEENVIRGSDITALRSLSGKMGFEYNISEGRNFDDVVKQVCFESEYQMKGAPELCRYG